MADNRKLIGKQDDVRININQSHERKYWTKKFNISERKLKKAVQTAGVLVKDVKAHLGI